MRNKHALIQIKQKKRPTISIVGLSLYGAEEETRKLNLKY
jgi:hypothetical protein